VQAIKPTNDAGRELLGALQLRLDTLRANLESVTLKPEETQVIRGRIAELKRLQEEVKNGGQQ